MILAGTRKSLAPSGEDLVRIGVSTSMKSWLSKKLLNALVTLCLSVKFACICDLLRSRTLWRSRSSSFGAASPLTSNGSRLDTLFKTPMLSATISTLPVGMFGFACRRSCTGPSTDTTHSARSSSATLWARGNLSGEVTTCTIPERSLMSRKRIPPIFLDLCTQPHTLTLSASLTTVPAGDLTGLAPSAENPAAFSRILVVAFVVAARSPTLLASPRAAQGITRCLHGSTGSTLLLVHCTNEDLMTSYSLSASVPIANLHVLPRASPRSSEGSAERGERDASDRTACSRPRPRRSATTCQAF
mmetsp:Transcript_13626/g.38312  ORF Transcript_13626/g.38312 Transcript_13626/m.38312 type:complete len:302 (+) Transcript_13626:1099-2004(+)